MRFEPSVIDEYLAALPEDWQVLALQAIKKEHDRLERGDLTEEEKRMFVLASDLGSAASATVNQVRRGALDV